MLKLGTQNIPALYLGGEQIQKAYLGETVVFRAGVGPGPSRLPEGYAEVEYIESSGTQWVNTGQKPNGNLRVVMDAYPLSTASKSSFLNSFYSQYVGVSTGTYFYHWFLHWRPTDRGVTGNMYFTVGDTSPSGININIDTTPRRMTLQLDAPNKKMSADGISVTTANVYADSRMPAFTMLSSGSVRLYSCQMYLSDEAVRDFVPCVDPTGAVGLYDLVGGQFYGNAGTGAFIAGPAV